jgi:hypothetical protein
MKRYEFDVEIIHEGTYMSMDIEWNVEVDEDDIDNYDSEEDMIYELEREAIQDIISNISIVPNFARAYDLD